MSEQSNFFSDVSFSSGTTGGYPKRDLSGKTTKVLPMVLDLDISPSNNWKLKGSTKTAIDYANEQIASLIKTICSNSDTAKYVELAIVVYSSKPTLYCDFTPIMDFQNNPPVFKTVEKGSTQTADSIHFCLDMIESYMDILKAAKISRYRPHLILITDGDPDLHESAQKRESATHRLNQHSSSEIPSQALRPIIIGVGDRFTEQTKRILYRYSLGPEGNCFFVDGTNDNEIEEQYQGLIKVISVSVKRSVKSNRRKKLDEISGKIKPFVPEDTLDRYE